MTLSTKAKFEAKFNQYKTMIQDDIAYFLSGSYLDDVIEGLTEDAHEVDKLHFNHPLLSEIVCDIADAKAKVKVSVDISYED